MVPFAFQVCPGGDWKKQYSKDEKVRARILYVDPTSKQIKLSLQPELVDLTVRKLPAVGQVFEVQSQAHELVFKPAMSVFQSVQVYKHVLAGG